MAPPSELADRVRALETRVADLEEVLAARRRPRASAIEHVSGWLDLETRLGLTWFNRLGAVALVAALAFAAAWAHDHGYLSPAVRTALVCTGAALLLVLACIKLRGARGGRRAFFAGVALLGAGGLFVAPVTAALVDDLISQTAAIAACVGLVAACLSIAALLDVFSLALLGTVGAALVPLISRDGEPQFALVIGYLAAVSVASVGVQLRRRWSGLDAVSVLSLSIYSLAWSGSAPSVASAVCGAAVWAVAIAFEHWQRARLRVRRAEARRATVMLAAAAAGGTGLLGAGAPWAATAGGVALLGAGPAWAVVPLIAANVWVWRDPGRPRQMFGLLALAAAGAVAFPSAVVGAILLPFSWQAIRRGEPVLAAVASVVTAAVWAQLGMEMGQPGLATAAAGAFAATCITIGIDEAKRSEALATALIAGGGVCAVVSTWPLAKILAPGQVPLVLTIATTAIGLAVVSIGMLAGLRFVRAAGLGALGLVAGKLIVMDVWALSSGTRVLALTALGAGLLGVSFLYSRAGSTRGESP